MRLVDLLIYLLEAQGQTLQRLAAFFGEEALLEILEQAGDASPEMETNEGDISLQILFPEGQSAHSSQSSAYAALESAVHELKLPAVFEFHLWAFPPYRQIIESPVDLQAILSPGASEQAVRLLDQVIRKSENWIKKLNIPPSVAPQAERAAQVPWIRFRSQVMKRIGLRPLAKL